MPDIYEQFLKLEAWELRFCLTCSLAGIEKALSLKNSERQILFRQCKTHKELLPTAVIELRRGIDKFSCAENELTIDVARVSRLSPHVELLITGSMVNVMFKMVDNKFECANVDAALFALHR